MNLTIPCLLAAMLAPRLATADPAKAPVSAAAVTISIERGPRPHEPPPETNAAGQVQMHPRWAVTLDATGRVVAIESTDAPPVAAIRTPLESANIPTFDPRGRRNHESCQRHCRVRAAVKAAVPA